MQTINYTDINGYGTVHAFGISIYLLGYKLDGPVNPIIFLSVYGTYHFGSNRVSFQMD